MDERQPSQHRAREASATPGNRSDDPHSALPKMHPAAQVQTQGVRAGAGQVGSVLGVGSGADSSIALPVPSEWDSSAEFSPSRVIQTLRPDSGSELELTALDFDTETFESASWPTPGDSDVTATALSDSGIQLGRPTDSGILLNPPADSDSDSEAEVQFEAVDSVEPLPVFLLNDEDDDRPHNGRPHAREMVTEAVPLDDEDSVQDIFALDDEMDQGVFARPLGQVSRPASPAPVPPASAVPVAPAPSEPSISTLDAARVRPAPEPTYSGPLVLMLGIVAVVMFFLVLVGLDLAANDRALLGDSVSPFGLIHHLAALFGL